MLMFLPDSPFNYSINIFFFPYSNYSKNIFFFHLGWICKMLRIDRCRHQRDICRKNCSKVSTCKTASERQGLITCSSVLYLFIKLKVLLAYCFQIFIYVLNFDWTYLSCCRWPRRLAFIAVFLTNTLSSSTLSLRTWIMCTFSWSCVVDG